MSGDLDLRIDELVLHGFAPHEQYRIRDALERALTRLFRDRGIPTGLASGATSPALDAGAFTVVAGSSPAAVGEQIALSLYERLGVASGGLAGGHDMPERPRTAGEAGKGRRAPSDNAGGSGAVVGPTPPAAHGEPTGGAS
jgi:hypothetical protein